MQIAKYKIQNCIMCWLCSRGVILVCVSAVINTTARNFVEGLASITSSDDQTEVQSFQKDRNLYYIFFKVCAICGGSVP